MSDIVSASEQKSIFLDIKDWLAKIVDSNINISVADMSADNSLSIVPAKGVKRYKEYACGGYEIYLPFSIYYRGIVDDDDTSSDMLDLLDTIGYKLENNGHTDIPKLELSGGRELLDAYQELTAVKFKQSGKTGEFTASYILIYSREE